MITEAIQCQTCYHSETIGHTYRTRGQANPGARDETSFQKRHDLCQNTYDERICFQKWETQRENNLPQRRLPFCVTKRVTISRVPRKNSKTIILDRYLEDERYRVDFQSEGMTKDEVKERDRICEQTKKRTRPY